MAITVYTSNGKVLTNSANDKWLKKKEAPAGFVMNASNATVGNLYVTWHSPSYPEGGYNGDNKQCIIINNNAEGLSIGVPTSGLMYGQSTTGGGPTAIDMSIIKTIGTSTGTMQANPVPSYGAYFVIAFNGTTEQIQAYLANLTITILDP